MKEATIRTGFGEISITFQTADELRDALKNLDEDVNTIQETTNTIVPPPPRSPKPGYENAYRFLSNGDLELLYIPKFRNEIVALVLYAYNPIPVSAAQIERITGIDDVARTVLGLRQNEDYFFKIGDNYALALDGFALVKQRIGDVLARSCGTSQPPAEQPQDEESQ